MDFAVEFSLLFAGLRFRATDISNKVGKQIMSYRYVMRNCFNYTNKKDHDKIKTSINLVLTSKFINLFDIIHSQMPSSSLPTHFQTNFIYKFLISSMHNHRLKS